jgi:hypothetical protein
MPPQWAARVLLGPMVVWTFAVAIASEADAASCLEKGFVKESLKCSACDKLASVITDDEGVSYNKPINLAKLLS